MLTTRPQRRSFTLASDLIIKCPCNTAFPTGGLWTTVSLWFALCWAIHSSLIQYVFVYVVPRDSYFLPASRSCMTQCHVLPAAAARTHSTAVSLHVTYWLPFECPYGLAYESYVNCGSVSRRQFYHKFQH
jgi:hypothetical protein